MPRDMRGRERCQERDKSRLPIIIKCEPTRARARGEGLLAFLNGNPKGKGRGFKTAAEAPRANLRVRARDGGKKAASQRFWEHGIGCVQDLTILPRERRWAVRRNEDVEWVQMHHRFVCREVSPLLTAI